MIFLSLLAALLVLPAAADARDPNVAALQVALRARGFYAGAVNGERGPSTTEAVRAFQRRAGLTADGSLGARTRVALGAFGRHALGSRPITTGVSGWDAAAVQFMLAWQGFPSGAIDGQFGERSTAALRQFQRWARLPVTGVTDAAVLKALRAQPARSPVRLAAPVAVAPTDRFGPRGDRFHAGLDFPAARGTRVTAGASGRVTHAGPLAGGWGNVVTVDYGSGVEAMHAHLSRVDVRVGQRVAVGASLGAVGATGHATGPHLHLELRLRGAAIDPLTAFPQTRTRPADPPLEIKPR
ncbi:MAG: peptidoglycan-binding protein [Thermoleophilia bacterium]|nr:peptidoglycan-binding protein [Thermoleophilia bacterium]